MTISVVGISRSCQAYQTQERLAERLREQDVQQSATQGDRVTISAQAFDLAAKALAEAAASPPKGFHGPVEPTPPPGI